MPNTLCLHWPTTEPGSEASRYAHALETRLRQLGVILTGDNAHCLELAPLGFLTDPAKSEPPLVSNLAPLMDAAGGALACRPDPALITVLAFSDTLDESESHLLGEVCAELARLAPYPVRFVVVSTAKSTTGAASLGVGLSRCAIDDPELPRLLLAADAALASGDWPRQNLLSAVCMGIPAVVRWPEASQPAPAELGLAVSGATPQQLAGLLLLLIIEPGVRRKVLDAQEALRQSQRPEAQLRQVAGWLAAQGVPAPQSFVIMSDEESRQTAAQAFRVEGVFDSSYSLAIVNRRLALALQDEGETVSLYSYEQGDDPQPAWHGLEAPDRLQAMWTLGQVPCHPAVSLRNAWPPLVRDMRARRRVLASYAWEETSFPRAFAEEFNLTLDLITVVSNQTARFLRDAGVHTPLAVVGNGVDHLLDVQPQPLPRPLPAVRFRFLHVSSCFPRKGVDVLLKAYGEAFSADDDVALVIKTFPNPHNDVKAQLERCRHDHPRYPQVELIEDDWTPGQIAALYQHCHALVAPSRGEGFGLPIAEAMLYGLPVIATGWGGHMDFCSDDTCWLIDYAPQLAQTHLSQTDSLWAEPSADHLGRLMKTLSGLPAGTVAAKTVRARQKVLNKYTWRQVAARTRAALQAVDARPGLTPALRVGWMTTWGSRCGIAAYSQHLVGAFSADELHIFAPSGEDTDQGDLPNVHRNWALEAANLDRVIADARKLALDALVVQFHWGFFGLGALITLMREMRTAGIRVVIDFHNTRSAPVAVAADEVVQALASAERLLVHTLDDMQRLKVLGLSANLALFPLAVYPIAQPTPAVVEAARQRLGLQGRQIIASYGFLLPHKGLLQLIEAMPALLAKRRDVHLLMVNALYSPERSGAEHRRLLARITELDLGDRVTLITDFLPEKECVTLLKLADLVVFPYQCTEESSSAAVRMALVANRPTAVTPLPIFADVAAAVSTLPGIDADSIATGIESLLTAFKNPDTQSAACARATSFVAERDAALLSRRLRGLLLGARNHVPVEVEPTC